MAENTSNERKVPRIGAARERYFVGMILFVTALTYASTLRFDFAFDDFPVIVYNPFIKTWRYLPQYLTSSVWKHLFPLLPGNYYRPLFMLLLRVNESMFGIRPLGWHLASVLLHLLVTWQVYVLVKRFSGQFTLAWLSAAIFGVHPVHHEVVAWVSATTESLIATLFLTAFLAFLKSKETSRVFWMGVSCAFYFLALLSKETAIILPALVFSFDWIDYEPSPELVGSRFVDRFQSAFSSAAIYLPFAVLYLIVRNHALNGFSHPGFALSIKDWLLTLPSMLLLYVRNFFVPVGLSEFYDLYYQHQFSVKLVAAPAMILIGIAGAAWFSRRRLGSKALGYGVAWSLLPLIPALYTFAFSPDQIVHDRYLYLPSIGLSFLAALIIDRAIQTRPALFGQPVHAVVAAIVLVPVLAFLSVRAVSYWRNDIALFTRAHQIAPLNATASNDVAAELIDLGKFDAALSILQGVHERNPQDSLAVFNLGRLYFDTKNLQQAEFFLQQAKALDPSAPRSYFFLGRIRTKQWRLPEAQAYLRTAVELDPYSASFHAGYGIVLAASGDCVNAEREFGTAESLNPGEAIPVIQNLHCGAIPSVLPPPAVKPG